MADCLPELVVGSGYGFSDQGFEFCKCDLDRVEIGGVWQQEQELCADVLEDRGGLWALVGGKVVEDDNVARLQGLGELGFDVEVEEFAIDGPADDPRRVQPVMAQGGNEGLGLSVAEGRVIDRP